MRYLNEKNITDLGTDWDEIIDVIGRSTEVLRCEDYRQPLKPYLRYHDPRNRIIAMPAYLGGSIQSAGIKWIASFPGNIGKKLPRAHSVVILNDPGTGVPLAVINTALLSGIRTAAVSGFVIEKYFQECCSNGRTLDCGIVGFGPIGQLHLQMLLDKFGSRIGTVFLYDLHGIGADIVRKYDADGKVVVMDNWIDVFNRSDLLITCTVSSFRYIDLPPEKNRLYINVSLRDFEVDFMRRVDVIIVDDWEEVCREDTDIERAHKGFGLKRDQVLTMADLLDAKGLSSRSSSSIMFNPMGMAIFDMAIGKYYFERAVSRRIGLELI